MNIIQVDGIKLGRNVAMFKDTNRKDILMKLANTKEPRNNFKILSKISNPGWL